MRENRVIPGRVSLLPRFSVDNLQDGTGYNDEYACANYNVNDDCYFCRAAGVFILFLRKAVQAFALLKNSGDYTLFDRIMQRCLEIAAI